MHTVDLLVVGRGQNVVDTAIAYIDGLGYRILGTTLDEEALDILDREQVRFLVIGGGVETESRKRLTAKADERGTTAVAAKRAGRDVEQYLADEVVPALRG
ncbi:hypothetical protein [Nocardia rhizosphaerihabitans]|uniref:Uncharacterized protein n=1 Tax=Nocardia rhizosphaerihabitans TaxID=1691570 RepID=A0ABQ2L0S4_9NOCA|nr:hypothetical protein [Nocardia rhizosphaerihabitans]GGN98949.1 hypothetical protein GCM10011610_66410 [Nocardia rhizosphaerihabitans]